MAEYEVPLQDAGQEGPPADGHRQPRLSAPLILGHVSWFCGLRWIVVAVLAAIGLFGTFSLPAHGGPAPWALGAAAVLALANALFLGHARLASKAGIGSATRNLWIQIVFDLTVLTVVVQYLGGASGIFPFAYLFHIVLACVFFPRLQSLSVTLLSCALYTVAVALCGPHGLPASALGRAAWSAGTDLAAVGSRVLFTQGIWIIVWYLTSRLALMLRQREEALARANQQLLCAQEERTRHMLSTTHQLKAPFAAIQANTQLLLNGYCGEIPPDARDIVVRISDRCRRLTREIQDMLQLANLRSEGQVRPDRRALDLDRLAASAIAQVDSLAEERGIRIERDLKPCRVWGVGEHLTMMLTNLLSNAVTYSHRDGSVRIACEATPDHGARLTIEDHGIGIAPEKISHIFDEYYRTEEAVQHNKESSGLGLAIVRHVARSHGVRLKVTSRPGEGTMFELAFPPSGAASREQETERRERNGRWPIS